MSFWTYMLQCADRHFYVGHTDDLEKRWGQHQLGTVPGYTRARRPVHLVWSAEFETRNEARQVELQLKGWGRPKKLALIRGDWAAISSLSRGKKEGRASTSSAKPVGGDAPGPLFLHPHPSMLPSESFNLEIEARSAPSKLRVRFCLTGDISLIRLPPPAPQSRRDGLWQHSCFEVFAQRDDGAYLEFNMSPSTEWAAYSFETYRSDMTALDVSPPTVRVTKTKVRLELKSEIALPSGFTPSRLGLSAVIEEISGRKSYWALAHPPGDAPDFHHPDCFAIELSPATAP